MPSPQEESRPGRLGRRGRNKAGGVQGEAGAQGGKEEGTKTTGAKNGHQPMLAAAAVAGAVLVALPLGLNAMDKKDHEVDYEAGGERTASPQTYSPNFTLDVPTTEPSQGSSVGEDAPGSHPKSSSSSSSSSTPAPAHNPTIPVSPPKTSHGPGIRAPQHSVGTSAQQNPHSSTGSARQAVSHPAPAHAAVPQPVSHPSTPHSQTARSTTEPGGSASSTPTEAPANAARTQPATGQGTDGTTPEAPPAQPSQPAQPDGAAVPDEHQADTPAGRTTATPEPTSSVQDTAARDDATLLAGRGDRTGHAGHAGRPGHYHGHRSGQSPQHGRAGGESWAPGRPNSPMAPATGSGTSTSSTPQAPAGAVGEEAALPETKGDTVVKATRVLQTGQSVESGRARLSMQEDGNLIIADENGTVRWSSHTEGKGHKAVFQADGHLVVYTSDGATAWSSGTEGHDGAELVLQSDGDVVIQQDGTSLWVSGTAH
jgi:hypothetical protein